MLKEDRHPSPLASMLKSRLALVELALAAIVLALGVEFAANGLVGLLSPSPRQDLLLAAAFISAGCLLFLWRVLVRRNHSVSFQGTVVCTKDGSRPLAVPEYGMGDGIANILKAGFSENTALQAQWSAGAPGSRFNLPGQSPEARDAALGAAELVEEAVEYFILESLSTHLTDYFNNTDRSPTGLVELRREQLPEVLLTNRFLSLFSTPMKDRAAFVSDSREPPHTGEILAAFAKGARYSRFDLVLPKQSTVTRGSSGEIVISTPRLRLKLAVRYDGFSSNLPFGFCDQYLGIHHGKVIARMVVVEAEVSLRLAGLVYGSWDYYRWVDSFFSRLEEQISFDEFLHTVRWPAISALLRCQSSGAANRQAPATDTKLQTKASGGKSDAGPEESGPAMK